MRKSVLLAVLILIPINFALAQVPAIERAALIALYDATNGPGWTDNSGWVTATVGTECTWYGVACVADLVNSLHLENNQLSGSIPPELGNTNLAYTLSLANNLLTGSIPPELGDLVGLDQLYLQNNQLTGSIPPELGNITRLQYLDLSANQLTGSIPPVRGNLAFL
jgi:Leucine-rich repeat (LRR) protein